MTHPTGAEPGPSGTAGAAVRTAWTLVPPIPRDVTPPTRSLPPRPEGRDPGGLEICKPGGTQIAEGDLEKCNARKKYAIKCKKKCKKGSDARKYAGAKYMHFLKLTYRCFEKHSKFFYI